MRLDKNKNNLNHLQHIILTSCVFYVYAWYVNTNHICQLGSV